DRATRAAAAARQLLGGVIKTREDALVAEAPKYAAELWTKGSQRFRDAMIENEGGDLKNAQRRAAEAEVLLREAELAAIKGGVLNEARALIAQAEAAKVARWAPRSCRPRVAIFWRPSRRSSAIATIWACRAIWRRRRATRHAMLHISRDSSRARSI